MVVNLPIYFKMLNLFILAVTTLVFQFFLVIKVPNQWIRALISSFIATLIVLIVHTIIDGELSNLWPFVFILYMPPAFILAILWDYLFKLVKNK